MKSAKEALALAGCLAIMTGGAGLLGVKHAEAIAEMSGIPVLLDLDGKEAEACATEIASTFGIQALGLTADVTQPEAIPDEVSKMLEAFGRVDMLISNTANNSKVEDPAAKQQWSRLENSPWMCGTKVWQWV